MSISIHSSYANHSGNAAYTAKKNMQTEKATTEKMQSSEEKVQAYYEELCKKFPEINFNTKGGKLQCASNKVVVNLSCDCLKKMANDPEFAREIEWNLSGETAANSMVYSWARRDGVELGGRTVTYDANGNRSSSCGGMRTAKARSNSIKKMQNQSQSMAERIREKREEKEKKEARLEEKRQERAEFEERMEEIRQERKAYLEQAVPNRTKRNDPWRDAVNEYEKLTHTVADALQPKAAYADLMEGFNITV